MKVICLLLLAIPTNAVLGFLGYGTPFNYVDEILILLYIYIIIRSYRKLSKIEKRVVVFLLFATIIGLLSNLKSRLIFNYIAISVDCLWLFKIPFSFIAMKILAGEKDYNTNPLGKFSFLSGILIVIGFILGVISLFVDIGMSEEIRYGIPIYHYVFNNSGQCGVWFMLLYLVFLCQRRIKKNKLLVLEILTITSVLFTTKGIPIMGIGTYFIFVYIFSQSPNNLNRKFRLKHLFVIIPVLMIMATYQIDSYLKDLDSPRMILMYYGFVTANYYFPLGSGFATYGSEMASRYYSSLYTQYGFDHIYGLQDLSIRDDLIGLSCLNDIYYVSILAQLGILGFILFMYTFYYIFKEVNKMDTSIKVKSMCIGIFVSLFIAGIASGMPKTAMGVFAFSLIGFIVGYNKNKNHGTQNFALLLVREK